jgi:hypothetical protein
MMMGNPVSRLMSDFAHSPRSSSLQPAVPISRLSMVIENDNPTSFGENELFHERPRVSALDVSSLWL